MQFWTSAVSGALRGARVGRTCAPDIPSLLFRPRYNILRPTTSPFQTRPLSISSLFKKPNAVPSPAVVASIGPLETAANNFPHDPAKQLALFSALAATKFKPSYKLITGRWERMCEFDQQSPVLKSDPVFESYLYALKEDGMAESIPSAVRRREALIGPSTVAEGEVSPSQAIADRVIAGNSNIGYQPPSFGEATGLNPVLAAVRANPLGGDQGSVGNPVTVKLVDSKGMLIFSMFKTLVTSLVFIMVAWVVVTIVIEKSGLLKSGPANVKTYEPLSNPTRFSDVHGIDEVKDDLQDVVEFLKDPSMFATLGGRLPKGVMLTGPPGTGKTLLARAVAGEADVPFFFASGSDFEEMFVGVGAKRVRDLFAAARKVQPSIIFIDELDAVGGKRTARDSQYMKQTLNQLLVEMDGFQPNDGIIVMAATNTPESLDSALMRPGRFDKIIAVPLPDIKGRVQILQHHMKGITIDHQVDTKRLAQGTTSFSGADIQNMVNQAAIQAAKEGAKAVNLTHFEWAIDKILMGAEMKSSGISKDAKKLTAYHEAGHALVSLYTEGATPLHKVTCNRRGHALGYTSFLPKDENYSFNYTNYLANIDVAMGGRLAEELVYGFNQSTSGCSSDLSGATSTADRMVKQFGFSKDVGMVYYTENYPPMSDMMREKIDRAVQQILADSVTRVRTLMSSKEKELHTLAEALLEYETLDSDQVRRILAGEELPSLREVLEGDVPSDPAL